jgi:hypothetical protein
MLIAISTYFTKMERNTVSDGIVGGLLAIAVIMIIYYFWGWTDYMINIWDPVFLDMEP